MAIQIIHYDIYYVNLQSQFTPFIPDRVTSLYEWYIKIEKRSYLYIFNIIYLSGNPFTHVSFCSQLASLSTYPTVNGRP